MYEPARMVAIRTTPQDNPHIWEEPDFTGSETRPVTHWGIGGDDGARPIAAPGKYCRAHDDRRQGVSRSRSRS